MNETTAQQPRGLHPNRLTPQAGNPCEVAFMEQWDWENEHHDLLNALFVVPCGLDEDGARPNTPWSAFAKMPLGDPTERDRVVVSTVVQWLGSAVGFSFLQESLKRVGYRIVRESD